ncbi:MAG: 5-oxoprolinase subunit PxpB [Chitinophagaceae bacterium]
MPLRMPEQANYTIFPLGDTALTIDFGNSIDEAINQKVLALFHALKENNLPGIIELVPAYSSLAVYYDIATIKKNYPAFSTAYEALKDQLERRLTQPVENKNLSSQLIKIPVCYDKEFALDIDELMAVKKISSEELIESHTSAIYTVYMLGFLPGFTYMGKIEDKIAMARKTNPRQRVEGGSVGIAGIQTGIYPLPCPGGWQIIGRTPIQLFNANTTSLTLLKPGDKVQFYSISKDEFNSY